MGTVTPLFPETKVIADLVYQGCVMVVDTCLRDVAKVGNSPPPQAITGVLEGMIDSTMAVVEHHVLTPEDILDVTKNCVEILLDCAERLSDVKGLDRHVVLPKSHIAALERRIGELERQVVTYAIKEAAGAT